MRFRLTEKFRILLEHGPDDFVKEMFRFKNKPEEALGLLQDYFDQANKQNSSVYKFIEDNKTGATHVVNFLCSAGEKDFYSALALLEKINLPALSKDQLTNTYTVMNLISNNKLDIHMKFLSNAQRWLSLVDRNVIEFEYAVKVLGTMYDPSKFGKEFGNRAAALDPDKHLFNGDKLKPSGNMDGDENDTGTIYGVVASFKRAVDAPGKFSLDSNRGSSSNTKRSVATNTDKMKEIPKDPSANGGNKVLEINGRFMWNERKKVWELDEG